MFFFQFLFGKPHRALTKDKSCGWELFIFYLLENGKVAKTKLFVIDTFTFCISLQNNISNRKWKVLYPRIARKGFLLLLLQYNFFENAIYPLSCIFDIIHMAYITLTDDRNHFVFSEDVFSKSEFSKGLFSESVLFES